MTSQAVAVTGVGLVTPAGIGARATWEGMQGATSYAAPDDLLAGLPVDFSCAVPDWEPDRVLGRMLSRRLDSPAQMAVLAAREALADAGLSSSGWDPYRVGVIIGAGTASFQHLHDVYGKILTGRHELVSPMALPRSLPSAPACAVALDLGAQGMSFAPSAACASGAVAIGLALQLLRAGSLDVVLAGGAESGRSAISAACFSQMGALSTRRRDPSGASRPFDADRDGFVLGEGAGVLVLESLKHARARQAHVYSYLAGYGSSTDAHHVTAPHPEGRGLKQALHEALGDASWTAADVDHLNAHGTATHLNDHIEARVLSDVFPQVPPVTAPKGALGHSIGASGAIEAALTVLTLRHQTIPPTANLDRPDPALASLDIVTKSPRPARLHKAISTSVAFGGHNAALAFHSATTESDIEMRI
ncbi:beta-ketoacyl-[acyl-carrier-protein] synthase family protein [Streptomyces sp. NPDC002784]